MGLAGLKGNTLLSYELSQAGHKLNVLGIHLLNAEKKYDGTFPKGCLVNYDL